MKITKRCCRKNCDNEYYRFGFCEEHYPFKKINRLALLNLMVLIGAVANIWMSIENDNIDAMWGWIVVITQTIIVLMLIHQR